MKNTIHLTYLIFFFIINALPAQISQNKYNRAINYCACNFVDAYAKNYTELNKDSNEAQAYYNFIKPAIDNCNIEDVITYSELKSLLNKYEFGNLENKLSPVISKLDADFEESMNTQEVLLMIITGIYENGALESLYTSYPGIIKQKSRVKTKLEYFFDLLKPESLSTETAKQNDPIEYDTSSNVLKTHAKKQTSSNWLYFILMLILFLAVIFFVFSQYRKGLNYKLETLERRLQAIESSGSKSSNNTEVTNERFNSYKKHIDDNVGNLKTRLEKLEKSIEKKQQYNSPVKQPVSSSTHTETKSRQTGPEPKTINNFYAYAPNKNGSFAISSLSSQIQESKTCYKITVDERTPNNAVFEFYSSEGSVKKATNTPEVFIKPVCESTQAIDQNAKNIITLKPGKLKKEGDLWVLIEKVEIKYG